MVEFLILKLVGNPMLAIIDKQQWHYGGGLKLKTFYPIYND